MSPRASCAIILLLLAATPGAAQREARAPRDGGLTRSLGQPPRLHRHVGIGGGWILGGTAELVAEGHAGLYTDLAPAPTGLAGLQVEAYAGARGSRFDYGVRVTAISPFLRLGMGLDLNGLDGKDYFLLSLIHPLRRGGVLGRGSQLRFN